MDTSDAIRRIADQSIHGLDGFCNVSRDAKNENSVSQRENGVLTRIQKSSGYSPEA